MSKLRVAVTSRIFQLLPYLENELLALYPDATFNADKLKFSEDELIEFVGDHDVAVIGLEPFTERVVSALPDLKVVSCCSSGVDHLEPAALRKRGVRVGWFAGINKVAVAELTIGLMINLLRKINLFNLDLRTGKWPLNKMGQHLRGRTVGIHGCGHIGKEVVKLLKPFGVTILACDRVDYADFYEEYEVTPVSAEELRRRSEILTLHLPKNSSTIGMYDDDALDQLRPDCLFINTSRGGIVDEVALKERLSTARIAAAASDVFATEPPSCQDLLSLPNFLGTPHIGGSAREAWEIMGRAGIKGITDNFLPEPGKYPFD